MAIKQLHQPTRLQTLANSEISKWITSQAKHLSRFLPNLDNKCQAEYILSQKIETIHAYFYYLPSIVLNPLFQEIQIQLSDLRSDIFHKEILRRTPYGRQKQLIVGRMIEVIFSQNLNELTLNYFEFDSFKASYCSKSYLLKGLIKLKLNVEPLSSSQTYSKESDIPELLRKLPNLEYLIIPHCHDSILNSIAENCTTIQKLDLHKYYNSSIEALDKLTHLPNLKKVYLYETSIGYLLDKLIENKKSPILKYISSRKLFEIISYVVYSDTMLDDLKLVIQMYPKLQSLSFRKTIASYTLEGCLKFLPNLQNLRELEIIEYNFYRDSVKEIIQIFGRNLNKLVLRCVESIDIQAIAYIGLICPNLYKLTIDDLNISAGDSPTFTESPLFKNLHKLKIDFTFSFLGITSTAQSALHFLLSNSPNIEHIDIKNIELPKDFLLTLLDVSPMKNLKVLHMPQDLDALVIDRIIEKGISPEMHSHNLVTIRN